MTRQGWADAKSIVRNSENVVTNNYDALAENIVVSAMDTEGFLAFQTRLNYPLLVSMMSAVADHDASVQFVRVAKLHQFENADVDNTTFSKISVNIEGTALASRYWLVRSRDSIAQVF